MTKSKNTKRALIVSAFSLLLCVSMLIGSTFAWFTDNASTGVNTIEAGTLDIELVDGEGNSVLGRTLDFAKAEGSENILWEPGCTWTLPDVYVKNNGTLALKYIVEITGIKGDAKLSEAIEWTIDYGYGEGKDEGHLAVNETSSNPISISGHMKEEAGNEYQGLTLEGIAITVRATQYTVEYDSTDNQYDKNAEYDMSVLADSTATIQELINKSAETGEPVTIKLSEDIVLDAILNFPAGADVTFDMNGKKMTAKDGSVDPFMDMKSGSSLVITGNGTFDLEDNYYTSMLFPRGDVTIENGTFLRDSGGTNYGSFFVGISNGTGELIINGGYFDGGSYTEGDCFNNCRNLLNCSWGQKVEVYGGTFVAQNPAWGDEGMAHLCTECEHTSTYCQGTFLVGQDWQDSEMPADYTITEGTTSDGRPTYTVTYTGTR